MLLIGLAEFVSRLSILSNSESCSVGVVASDGDPAAGKS